MVGWWHIQKISWKAWTALTKMVLTTGYNEWQPAEKSSLVWERAENMPKWCSFCLQGMVDIRKDAMCGFQVSDCVCVCVWSCVHTASLCICPCITFVCLSGTVIMLSPSRSRLHLLLWLLVLGLLWERWIEGSLSLWVRGLGLQTCSSPVWDFAPMPDT